MIKIKKGLNIPLVGAPVQGIIDAKGCRHVAIIGDDYVGMNPAFLWSLAPRF
jgi:Na+-transporting NADH:ubiquinone oxidoreductase subunit A